MACSEAAMVITKPFKRKELKESQSENKTFLVESSLSKVLNDLVKITIEALKSFTKKFKEEFEQKLEKNKEDFDQKFEKNQENFEQKLEKNKEQYDQKTES